MGARVLLLRPPAACCACLLSLRSTHALLRAPRDPRDPCLGCLPSPPTPHPTLTPADAEAERRRMATLYEAYTQARAAPDTCYLCR